MANSTPPKARICLWYDRDAEAAAKFYAQTFPNSRVRGVQRAPNARETVIAEKFLLCDVQQPRAHRRAGILALLSHWR